MDSNFYITVNKEKDPEGDKGEGSLYRGGRLYARVGKIHKGEASR
jgi:hypothetical protein